MLAKDALLRCPAPPFHQALPRCEVPPPLPASKTQATHGSGFPILISKHFQR